MLAVGLMFLGLTAYRAGNDPLVLTLTPGRCWQLLSPFAQVPMLGSRAGILWFPCSPSCGSGGCANADQGWAVRRRSRPPGSVWPQRAFQFSRARCVSATASAVDANVGGGCRGNRWSRRRRVGGLSRRISGRALIAAHVLRLEWSTRCARFLTPSSCQPLPVS